MMRVMKMEEEDLLQGEVPVPLDEQSYRMAYQVITDPKFPGQFRVVRYMSFDVIVVVCGCGVCVRASLFLSVSILTATNEGDR